MDNGSGVNVLFKDAAEKMGILDTTNKGKTTLHTIKGTHVHPLGTLKLTIQAEPYNLLVTFHIMDCSTPHNVILVQDWFHKMIVIPLTYHQVFLYPALNRIKEIKGDQEVTRYCDVERTNMIHKGKWSSYTPMDKST